MQSRNWKDIPKQTCLVENGVIGDCWRCCIAAVLGLPAEDVPHFGCAEDGEWNHCCDPDTQKWINHRGYVIAYASAVGGSRSAFVVPHYSADSDIFHSMPLIACGPTQRSIGLGKHHAVVMVGSDIVYDPHPSESGLTAIIEQWLIFKPIELPMPVDPTTR